MTSTHAWLITADLACYDVGGDRGEDDIGRLGPGEPHTIDPVLTERLRNGDGEPFQLWDTETAMALFYEGRIVTQLGALHASQSDDDIALAPLRWAAEAAGCTEIRYWVDGDWVAR